MDRESGRGQYAISYFTSPEAERPANFFPLPNAIFHIGLSASEIAVYSFLMYCEDRRSHQCWLSYKTIGKAVGISANTVRKYVHKLWYKELIQIESSTYESGGQIRNGNLKYKILPIQRAIDSYNEGLVEVTANPTSAVCGACEDRVGRAAGDEGQQGRGPCWAFVAICEGGIRREGKPLQICK